MNKTITLTIAMLFTITFVINQNAQLQNINNKEIEKLLKEFGLSGNQSRSNARTTKDNGFFEYPGLKSTLDQLQKLDSTVYQNWVDSTGLYINGFKSDYTYDNNGNIFQEMDSNWDENSLQWIPSYYTGYSWDANGLLTSIYGSEWDVVGNEWLQAEKTEFVYDSNDMLVLVGFFVWDAINEQWTNEQKDEYSYNAIGKLDIKIHSGWEATNEEWLPVKKNKYSYDINENLIEDLIYNWSSAGSEWLSVRYIQFTYGANENLVQEMRFNWVEGTGQWQPYFKIGYTYDDYDNIEEYIVYVGQGQWTALFKNRFVYDNSFSFSDLILPVNFLDMFFNHMALNSYSYYWDNGLNDWGLSSASSYHYSLQQLTYIPESLENELLVYPNPANKNIRINFTGTDVQQIVITDMTGKTVIEMSDVFSNRNIDILKLENGVYIVKAKTKKGIKTSKIIKY